MKNCIVTNPGRETWEENRAWQGCPTIARTRGGRLFAGWYTGGMFEPCIDNFNVLVKSDDDGKTWSHPILAVYSDREKRERNIDIQLWIDERDALWIMWTHSPYPEDAEPATIRTPFRMNYHNSFTGVEVLLCRDPDADELVFEDPRVITGGFLRCKPIILRDGRYLFPAYDWEVPDRYVLRFSSDGGKTFVDKLAAKKPDNRVFDETMVFETKEGDLRLLARTNRGYYATSLSSDGGETWSETEEFEKAPSTRFYIARLQSGRLVYVRNVSDTERNGMKVMLSEDDGKTWAGSLVLDARPGVSYPDLAEDGKGRLYIVHDCERDNRARLNRETWHSEAAKEILLSSVTEEEILRGEIGEGSFTARVISKALIDDVEK